MRQYDRDAVAGLLDANVLRLALAQHLDDAHLTVFSPKGERSREIRKVSLPIPTEMEELRKGRFGSAHMPVREFW